MTEIIFFSSSSSKDWLNWLAELDVFIVDSLTDPKNRTGLFLLKACIPNKNANDTIEIERSLGHFGHHYKSF